MSTLGSVFISEGRRDRGSMQHFSSSLSVS